MILDISLDPQKTRAISGVEPPMDFVGKTFRIFLGILRRERFRMRAPPNGYLVFQCLQLD
jgi:hypothetical protein